MSSWLVGPNGDPVTMPRYSEQGGMIEHAAFVICNAGLAALSTFGGLLLNEATADGTFPGGHIGLHFADRPNDKIRIMIESDREIVVRYLRDNKVICEHYGLDSLWGRGDSITLRDAVSIIAGLIVQVHNLDDKKGKIKAA